MGDTEQGSEELSITSASFSRTTDLKLHKIINDQYGFSQHTLISDIARLSKDKLIIVDNSRCNVVTFAGPSTGQIDYIDLQKHGPLKIAVSSHNRALVSSRTALLLLSTSPTLTVINRIDVPKPCFGVGFADNHLVLNFEDSIAIRECEKGWQSEDEIVNIQGQGRGYRFRRLTDVKAVTENGRPTFYTSDTPAFDTKLVTKLSVSGDVLATYNDWEIGDISSLCPTGDGNVLVCNSSGNFILLLSPGMRDAKVILDAKDGIDRPQAICFCPEERKLFVSRECHGHGREDAYGFCICTKLMVFDMQ